MTRATPVFALLQTVFYSILEVFLVCLAGWILARRGILDKKTQKQLNVLNVSLFTPCLLFSKVAFFLSPAKLKELWIIPLFFAAVSLVSMGVAWLMSWLFRIKRSQRNFAMAAAMFMNSNSLPIALLQSLVVTVPGLQWGDDDNKDAMVGRALTYLVMCSTLGMIVRWSYGVRLLSQADPESAPEPALGQNDEASPLLRGRDDPFLPDETRPQESNQFSHLDATDADVERNMSHHEPLIPSISVEVPSDDVPTPHHNNHLSPRSASNPSSNTVFHSFPNTPYQSVTPDQSDYDSDEDELPAPWVGRRVTSEPRPSRPRAIWLKTKKHVKTIAKSINGFMTAPLWAALLSLIVALIPALQHSLEVHIWPVKAAVSQAGNCSIPLTLVVLGAYFHRPSTPTSKNATRPKGGRWRRAASRSSLVNSVREMLSLKAAHSSEDEATEDEEERRGRMQRKVAQQGETKTVFVAVVARMVIVPALFLPLMVLGAWLDLPTVFEDPVFVLALVLLASSPPALTLAQITQAASGDAFERLLSRTIFWSYCVVTPPATILYSVLAMLITKL